MNQKSKNVVKTIVNVFLWIFMVFACCMTILAFLSNSSSSGIPSIGKTTFMSVLSPSMDNVDNGSGFRAGDLIFSKILTPDEARNLKEGDVITFYADVNHDGQKERNTHRITAIASRDDAMAVTYYRTKGDNPALIEDAAVVSSDDIESQWMEGKRLPGMGKALLFLQTSTGFLCCIVIPLGILFIYELVLFLTNLGKYRNKDKKMITKDDEEMIRQKAIEEYLARQAAEKAQAETASKDAENHDDKGEQA